MGGCSSAIRLAGWRSTASWTPYRIDSSSGLSGLADGRRGKSPFDKLPPDIFAARRKAAEETNGDLGLPAPPPSAFGVPMQSTPNG